jgi:hypothetical protein
MIAIPLYLTGERRKSMLIGKNIVTLEKGTKQKEYDRVYLTHGPEDKLEDFGKTSEKKPLMFNGAVWQGKRPATVKEGTKQVTVPTVHKVSDLMQAALDYAVGQYPFDEKLTDDATAEQIAAYEQRKADWLWTLALNLMDSGLDMRVRGEIQSDLQGVLTPAEATQRFVRDQMKAGKTREQAEKLAAKLAALEAEEAAA